MLVLDVVNVMVKSGINIVLEVHRTLKDVKNVVRIVKVGGSF